MTYRQHDWGRILRLRLSGEKTYRDQEALRDFWLVESGTAGEYLTEVATRCGAQAYAEVAASLVPLMVKKGERFSYFAHAYINLTSIPLVCRRSGREGEASS